MCFKKLPTLKIMMSSAKNKPVSETAEGKRLLENKNKEVPLPLWGPYLSERQWGTVREDYSENGEPWQYFPHDHARSRAYLWGEDGLGGISDYGQNICFSVALWNGKDPILKERLFGLANGEGNHGEDVKELYYYLDNTPTHGYMKFLYKMCQQEYPYLDLLNTNKKRSKQEPEYEILDTGVFDDGKYFDVFTEYAKAGEADLYIKITVVNLGSKAAPLTVLPSLWFYNRWQYGGMEQKPLLQKINDHTIKSTHERTGDYYLYLQQATDVLFTENETNNERLFNKPNKTEFVKDAFHEAIINGKNYEELKLKNEGTKCAAVYQQVIEPGAEKIIYLRLCTQQTVTPFTKNFEDIFVKVEAEADEFYEAIITDKSSEDVVNMQRQAFAGLLWSKQYYHYDIQRWLQNSDGITPVTEERLQGRNSDWKYLKNQDIMLMPDKWEYPWYAAWDTAFQCIAVGIADPGYAKHQLILLMREWYMSPDGQIPAYEWDFSDINPPVHAFAALQVYKTERDMYGEADLNFLKRIFQKLVINFTWWVNKTDKNGNNVFEGGFLGLDNIGVFNRSIHVSDEFVLDQADGTSWVGMYALNLMEIAIEISLHDISFQDTATKFYEHFVIIAEALNSLGLWNEEDKFFYDILTLKNGEQIPLKVKSVVGISPIFDVAIICKDALEKMGDFTKRIKWFDNYRRDNNLFLPNSKRTDNDGMLLSMVKEDKLLQILHTVLSEKEFLAPGGLRSVSACHRNNPFSIDLNGQTYSLSYDPGDSTSGMFGGNSNWRGPVWMPINYLIITTLKKYGQFYGDELKAEYPTGSEHHINFSQLADALTQRLVSIFVKDEQGNRPVYGGYNSFYNRPENKELILFYEYYHGDTSRGLGASHQTGWSAVLVELLRK